MSHITHERKEIMINYMKDNPKLNVGKFSPDFTRVQARTLWQELTDILNSHANGAKKEWSAWRKTWIVIKKIEKPKRLKTKNIRETQEEDLLNKWLLTKLVMELMSPVCVTGNLEVPEPSLTIEQIFSRTKQIDVEESSDQNAKPDHNYHLPTDIDINISEPEETKNVSSHLLKRKRMTKTTRLKESIKNHSKMVKLTESGIKHLNSYHVEKIEILKSQHEEIKKQTNVLENISVSLQNISEIMREFL